MSTPAILPKMKRCTKCGETKPLTEFALRKEKDYKNTTRVSHCRECTRQYQRQRHLKRTYGITVEQAEQLKANGCAICQRTDVSLVIDHDHNCCPGRISCGKCIRGALCPRCNFWEGVLRENLGLLTATLDYVAKYRDTVTNVTPPRVDTD